MWGYYGDFYPRSRPRQARGGIKAQSRSGQFGQTWWARRWIEVLESFDIGARLSRGRSYARSGQVLDLAVSRGKATARVQGSRPRPYDVAIQVRPLPEKDWNRVLRALAGQALYTAKLLAGEMPTEIEEVFQQAGVSLFPNRRDDLVTSCSCPDWSNPCKHVAAVYYLIGEAFDRDPFLIFRLRGLERDELMRRLGKPAGKAARTAVEEEPPPPVATEELPADPRAYWAPAAVPADLYGDVAVPPVAAAWPKRLGSFPFWRGTERFLDALEPMYRAAGQRGLAVFQ